MLPRVDMRSVTREARIARMFVAGGSGARARY